MFRSSIPVFSSTYTFFEVEAGAELPFFTVSTTRKLILREKYIWETTYLAYITSEEYGVDQVEYKINGVSGTEAISDFYAKITASLGANAMLVGENGDEKTSGDIDRTDKVKVVSADGKIEVYYTFGTLTSTNMVETLKIEIYPNPTNGKLNISGVALGNQVQVFNSLGALVQEVQVGKTIESISLDKQPAGLYLVVVSNGNNLLGRFKAIKN